MLLKCYGTDVGIHYIFMHFWVFFLHCNNHASASGFEDPNMGLPKDYYVYCSKGVLKDWRL